jgi:hypothetical protein
VCTNLPPEAPEWGVSAHSIEDRSPQIRFRMAESLAFFLSYNWQLPRSK